MRIPTKEQVLMLRRELIATHGGSDGIRDEGLLDSALATPFHTFDGQPMLQTVQQKATRHGYGLRMNHAFIDGNKRIDVHVMLTMLAINGIELEYTQKNYMKPFCRLHQVRYLMTCF